MKLPANFNFLKAVHAEDESILLDAMDFGVQAIYKTLQRFH